MGTLVSTLHLFVTYDCLSKQVTTDTSSLM